MQNDSSGAGYGNHAGDESFDGQDGAKSGDHEQGKPIGDSKRSGDTLPDGEKPGAGEDGSAR